MGKKVNISEVIEFSNDMETATVDLESGLIKVEKSIDRLNVMSSFSGKTAREAKEYFNTLHQTVLKSYEHLFTELDESLKGHLNSFQSRVDSSNFAIIESDYLNELEEHVNEDYEHLTEQQESIRETIANVSEISSANHPSTWAVTSGHKSVVEIISNIETKLESFTSLNEQEVSEVGELIHHIETTIQEAGAMPGDGRFAEYTKNSISISLLALKGQNHERHMAVVNEAEKAKDAAIKDMDDSSQEILIKALKDLEKGEIDEAEYYNYLTELNKLTNEEDLEEEVSESFFQYVTDNFGGVTDDVESNFIAAYLKQSIQDTRNNKLSRAELVKAMSAHKASSTYNYLKKSGDRLLNVGRAVSTTLFGVTIVAGTYWDYNLTDKTLGEAFAKNATGGGVGLLMTVGSSATIMGLTAASNPVGWAVVGGIAVGTAGTCTFNFAYDNNYGGIQDGVDWAGQQIDKGMDWTNEQLDKAGEAISNGLEFINPFS